MAVTVTDATPEGALAALAAGLTWADIPRDVVDAAVDCIIDTVAVALGARLDPAVALVRPLTDDPGSCTRLADGAMVGMRSAALANGVAAHVLDFDDWLPSAGLHPSAPLLPAVLATAEDVRARDGALPGSRLVAAYIAGFEVQARIGTAIAPGHYEAGYHPTATVGVFGAAAAAAHLRDLGPDATLRALGLAAVQAAGLRTSFGTTGKSLQVGRAAEAGLVSASLAAAGASAPDAAVFGPSGFAATHSDTVDESLAQADVADRWYLRDVLLKRHAACFGTHAPIDALLQLRDGLDLDEVRGVEVTVSEIMRTVCAIPSPQTPLEGKFSIAFAAALALVRGTSGVADFTDDAVRDQRLRSVTEKVRLHFDPLLPPQQASVRVLMNDGTTRTAGADSAALPPPSVRTATAREKLEALGVAALGVEGTSTLLRELDALRSAAAPTDIGALLRALAPSRLADPSPTRPG